MRVNLFNRTRVQEDSTAAANAQIFGDREGFSILASEFEMPKDSISLDRKSKRALTICNLFINHQLGVSQISQLLEDDLSQVVRVLLEKRMIRDRRGKSSRWPLNIERRKPVC